MRLNSLNGFLNHLIMTKKIKNKNDVYSPTRPQLRNVLGRVLWSKVTEVGGGKCYLQTNLDDLTDEIAAALAEGATSSATPEKDNIDKKIIKEGTITITSEGNILIQNFSVIGYSFNELGKLATDRVRLAIKKLDEN